MLLEVCVFEPPGLYDESIIGWQVAHIGCGCPVRQLESCLFEPQGLMVKAAVDISGGRRHRQLKGYFGVLSFEGYVGTGHCSPPSVGCIGGPESFELSVNLCSEKDSIQCRLCDGNPRAAYTRT